MIISGGVKSRVKRLFLALVLVTVPLQGEAQFSGSDIQAQAQISKGLMLQNISRPGTHSGSVVASVSQQNPDYFYHWIRDAAVVMDSVIDLYVGAQNQNEKQVLGKMLFDYVEFSRSNQVTPNPSGGLGEPKFNVDGSAYTKPWGRPQNDGPALRADALTKLARVLIQEGQIKFVQEKLYDSKMPTNSVIKADLEFVGHHWNDPCFDLWEEVQGHHFFTLMIQRKSLIDGARLASTLGDQGAASFYNTQAQAIGKALQQFWDQQRGILVPTISGQFARLRVRSLRTGITKDSGLDVAVVLGITHGYAGDGFLSPGSDMVLSTAFKIQQDFQGRYRINQNTNLAPAIGRYPEDIYNGNGTGEGNPWFLTTLAFAELYYQARVEFGRQGVIKVSTLNKPFFDSVLQGGGSVNPGDVFQSGSPQFQAIMGGLMAAADGFFFRVLFHKAGDGSLSEEFNRNSGVMQGASNLTWSHASVLSAFKWRSIR